MRRAALIPVHVLSICLTAVAIDAKPTVNPYSAIAVRNVFALRPILPVTKPAEAPPPLPSIVLTGIVTILGDRRVFMEITPVSKPGKPEPAKTCMLEEGQTEINVKVIHIDPAAKTVTVSNQGTIMTLTFDTNGRKSVPHPASPVPPRFAPGQFATSMPGSLRRWPLRAR